nr:YhdT family protein [uncultured Pseudodesulfovibrio sp.]
MNKQSQDPRFKQANKEALLALGVYALYFVWWYVCAYGMGSGNPDNYSYVLGMPEWFFYSCIVGYPLVTILLWIVVRFNFKDMPLDADTGAPSIDINKGTDANSKGKR